MATKVKGGKWKALRGKYPVYVENPGFQEKVNEEKKRILDDAENPQDANPAALSRLYVTVRLQKAALEEEIKTKNVTLQALIQMVFDGLENEGTESIGLSDGVGISLLDEPIPSAANRNELTQWALDTGQASILSIHPMSLKSIVKEALVNGNPLPPSVKVFMKRGLRVTGLKGLENGDE